MEEIQLFKKLRKKLDYLNEKQIERIIDAYKFAYEAHTGQKRVSGDIYISHPIAVATTLAELHMDSESIIAALLHDVIEDTSLDKKVVTKKFGKTVAEIVDGVTKLTKIQFSSAAEAQAENFRKMILAMSNDLRVILIKLADRLHNMRTIDSLLPHKRQRIAKETLEIYAPIAHRLGLHEIFVELENLGFLTLFPRRFKIIQDSVKKARGNRKEIISIIEKELKKGFAHSSLKNVKISGREKQIYSIYKKMRRKHLPFSEVMDVYGFRIIVNSIDDCYQALGITHSLYKPIPGKFKDYIAIPKINGYQSLHTTLFGPHGVPIEIQIRTEEMERLASKGIAAHWLYKTEEKLDTAHFRAQQWINDLLEIQQKTGSSIEFVENVKVDLFPDMIYVFTPKGRIMELPRGSTPIDFAYAVHTDIGNTCTEVHVERKSVPISTELISGQTIDISTEKNARPNPAWLNFVRTVKARSAIRHFLKNQKRSEAISLGNQLLAKALNNFNLSLNNIPAEVINTILKELNLPDVETLYAEIGIGNKVAIFVANQIAQLIKKPLDPETIEKLSEMPLLIKGAEGMVVHFANCCCPVPGDPIIACVSPGKGLIVHTSSCKNTAKLQKQAEKCVLVRWADDVKGDFLVIIHLEMSSKRGTFATLTKTIADEDASIEDIVINNRTGELYFITLKVLVKNRDQLQKVLHRVNSLDIVSKANRI